MPEIPDVIPGEPIESEWGNDVRDRSTQRYNDATARDNLVPFPQDGMISWLDDPGVLEQYDGTDWLRLVAVDFADETYVNRVGDSMSGFLTLAANPINPFHAATKQYVDNQDLIPQAGALLDASSFQGVVAPGPTDTVLATVNVAIPALALGRPTVTTVATMLRAANASENDAFEVWSSVDGQFNLRSTTGFPVITQTGHTHDTQGSTTTGSASGHQHTIAVGLHNHSARTPSVNVGVSSLTASNNHLVNLALPGAGFSVQFIGRIRSGTPATWHLNAQALTYLAP